MAARIAMVGAGGVAARHVRVLTGLGAEVVAVADPVRDLLCWMNDPEGTRRSLAQVRWPTFRGVCRSSFGFDPDGENPTVAADRLIMGGGLWDSAWQRFRDLRRSDVARPLAEVVETAVGLAGGQPP